MAVKVFCPSPLHILSVMLNNPVWSKRNLKRSDGPSCLLSLKLMGNKAKGFRLVMMFLLAEQRNEINLLWSGYSTPPFLKLHPFIFYFPWLFYLLLFSRLSRVWLFWLHGLQHVRLLCPSTPESSWTGMIIKSFSYGKLFTSSQGASIYWMFPKGPASSLV